MIDQQRTAFDALPVTRAALAQKQGENMTTKTENIIEGIQRQCDRVREILPLYDEIPTGVFAATMMRNSIKAAEAAIASGDVLAMLAAYKDLEGYEA